MIEKKGVPASYFKKAINKINNDVSTINNDLSDLDDRVTELENSPSVPEDLVDMVDDTAESLELLWKLNKDSTYGFKTEETEAVSVDVPKGAVQGKISAIGGKTVVWNQLVNYQTFSATLGTKNVSFTDGKVNLTFTASGTNSVLRCYFKEQKISKGHLYYSANPSRKSRTIFSQSGSQIVVGLNEIFTVSEDFLANRINLTDAETRQENEVLSFDFPMIFDLTLMFGAGNEPDLETCKKIFTAEYYPYCLPELRSVEVDEVEIRGRNLFDGVVSVAQSYIYLSHAPNGVTAVLDAGTYTVSYEADLLSHIFVRDENNVQIAVVYNSKKLTFTLDRRKAVKIFIQQSGLNLDLFKWAQLEKGSDVTDFTSYIDPISIDLHPIIQKYFPNGMKSAGSVHDEIDFENGVAVQRIGSVDLGLINVRGVSNGYVQFSADDSIKPVDASTVIANVLHKDYTADTQQNVYGRKTDKTIAIAVDSSVRIYDSAITFTSSAETQQMFDGQIIYYENAEPIITPIDPEDLALLKAFLVEEGGSITFHQTQEPQLDVPSKVEYLVKKNAVENVFFIAEYGVTTFQEIKDSYDKGMLCVALEGVRRYWLTDVGSTRINFAGFTADGITVNAAINSSSVWTHTLYTKTTSVASSPSDYKFPTSKAVVDYAEPKKGEWVLKGTLTTDNKDTGVNVDLTGCNEFIIKGLGVATGNASLIAYKRAGVSGDLIVYNAFTTTKKQTYSRFENTEAGFDCIVSKYSSSTLDRLTFLADNNSGYCGLTGAHLSDYTVFGFNIPANMTSCNIEIWAR